MKNVYSDFRKFWTEERSLTMLMIILCVQFFLVIPLGEYSIPTKFIMATFFILLLSAGMSFLVKTVMLRALIICTLGVLFFLGSGIIYQSVVFKLLENLALALYCMLLSWVVLQHTFRKGPVTVHRVQGAVVAFMLISMVFGMLYHSIILLNHPDAFKGGSTYDRKEMMYFSLTTLTTTGYGDIAPVLPIARSLANMESLIGMLYPVMLIARLVSLSQTVSETTNDATIETPKD